MSHLTKAAGFGQRRRGAGGPNASASARTCPDCGLQIRDRTAARLGFCSSCGDFTGMCAAGRKIVFLDMMSMTSWHTPCTQLGSAAWQVLFEGADRSVLLCPEHDAQVLAGRASWISRARRLADVAAP
jgi:ribosomal protein L37AE/L43A